MTKSTLERLLNNNRNYDLVFNTKSKSDNGMKISIQGKSIDDSIYLYNKLYKYLYSNDIPFKLATKKRYDLYNNNNNNNIEQSRKAMTIYCVNGMDFKKLCEEVYTLTIKYKGWYDIKTPTKYEHYAGGLFIRNDRDENGIYIPAK